MIFYTQQEKNRIIYGAGIPLTLCKEVQSKCFVGYAKHWKETTWNTLKSIGTNDIFALRVINGEYDHRKSLLIEHSKLFNQEHLVNKIWNLIK